MVKIFLWIVLIIVYIQIGLGVSLLLYMIDYHICESEYGDHFSKEVYYLGTILWPIYLCISILYLPFALTISLTKYLIDKVEDSIKKEKY